MTTIARKYRLAHVNFINFSMLYKKWKN